MSDQDLSGLSDLQLRRELRRALRAGDMARVFAIVDEAFGREEIDVRSSGAIGVDSPRQPEPPERDVDVDEIPWTS